GSSGFLRALVHSFYDLKNVEIHALHTKNIDEITDIDHSPLQKSQSEHGAANIKLILSCNGFYYSDILSRGSNLALQRILADYRDLSATSIPSEGLAARNRLKAGMSELRVHLQSCNM
ncbi:MAG TPA: hypothetical protein VN642_08535, partial [Dongiaceae bacterium]|nr:hypothetical protein [Dongiaceae bacterium]